MPESEARMTGNKNYTCVTFALRLPMIPQEVIAKPEVTFWEFDQWLISALNNKLNSV